MAEKITVARPYAQAVFEIAAGDKKLGEWSETLRLLSAVAADRRVMRIVDNPSLTREQITSLFFDVCGDALDRSARAMVNVLAENGRLGLLPEISELYEEYRAEAERIVHAEVISAYAVTDGQRAAIVEALKRRTGRDVELECRTDDSLIGGAVIRAGDVVIDGSVSGHLDRLASTLSH